MKGPLRRAPYVSVGVALFGLKLTLDASVARAFSRPFSPLFYVSPMDAPLFRPSEDLPYWLTMWGLALPFLFVGVLLTLRRLRDAGLPAWMASFFFVPFANLLFFVAAASAPSRTAVPDEPVPGQPRYRAAAVDTHLDPPARSVTSSVFLAGLLGSVIGLGAVGISVGLLRAYGAGLMLGAPVLSGFATSTLFVKLHPSRTFLGGAALATAVSFVISFGVVIGFALEGLGCLAMALPLIVPVVFFGSYVGYTLAKERVGRGYALACAPFVLLPVILGAEHAGPQPEPRVEAVVSEVVVDAPPEVVWKRVIAFPPLPAPHVGLDDLLHSSRVAVPLRATIDGEGVGAVRRCEFTTGTFVEPIVVWDPGHELSFGVTSQPDPMRELTLWDNVRPPHLDGYLQTTRGQFLLEPLAGGKTRLTGRTWYRVRMQPEGYFRLWADAIIHAIHLRVLRHVAGLAERDARAAAQG
jgi:uncharacterized membrane protein YhaH (DUF805 family)